MTMFAALALILARSSTSGEPQSPNCADDRDPSGTYGLALLIVMPYIFYLFAYGQPRGEIWSTVGFSADLLNFLIPTNVNALGTLGPIQKFATTFTGNDFERTAYIGPVLIGVAVAYARRHWKERFGKVLIDSLVVICVLSVGPKLHFCGRELAAMPAKSLAVMPVIDKALPVRFTMYAFLILAIIASLWLATSTVSIITKRVVAIIGLLFSIPNLDASYWTTKIDTPAFFADGLYRKYISPGDNVLIAPYWIMGNSMLWAGSNRDVFPHDGRIHGTITRSGEALALG
jgi:hypothetical protein